MWPLSLSVRTGSLFSGGQSRGPNGPGLSPLSSRPSSGPALPAPSLRAGQRSRRGPARPRQPSVPAGAWGAAGAGQRCPRPGSGCRGRRRGQGRGESPGAGAGLGWGKSHRAPAAPAGMGGPREPHGGAGRPQGAPEKAAALGRYRPAPPARAALRARAQPSLCPSPRRHPSKCGKHFGFSRRRTKKQQLSLRLDQMNTDLTSLFKNLTARARKRYCASVKYKVLSITIIAAIMI